MFFNHLENKPFSFAIFLLPVTEKVKIDLASYFCPELLLFQNERVASSALSLGKFWRSSSKGVYKNEEKF